MYKSDLTPKQRNVLLAIEHLFRINSVSPTLEEIRQYLNYSNTSSVQRHIEPLIKKGYLRNQENKSRSFEVISSNIDLINIPLVGNIACGIPIHAEENIEAYIPYPKQDTKYSVSELFFLRAIGDSMNDYCIKNKPIHDGDFVLIHQQSNADLGQPVVALVGDEATIKIFSKDTNLGAYVLKPKSNNPKHKPILIFDNLSIQGVAVDVIKPKLLN